MFCSHCGKELQEAAAFCMYCGSPTGQIKLLNEPPALPGLQQTGDSRSIASLVCGIGSLLTFGGFLIVPIIGLFLGLKAKRSGITLTGIGLNIVALVWCLALVIPAGQEARETARRMQCANHEKQIGLAFHNYHETHGALPPLYTVDEEGKPLHSWRVLILPYIEQKSLYDQIRLDEPWDSVHNKQFHDQMPSIYKCPSHPGDRQRDCTYSAVADWSFVPAKKAGNVLGLNFADFTGELHNTLALVEVQEPFNWMNPIADVSLNDVAQGNRVGSYHTHGINAMNMDVSIMVIAPAQLKIRAARKVEEKESHKK